MQLVPCHFHSEQHVDPAVRMDGSMDMDEETSIPYSQASCIALKLRGFCSHASWETSLKCGGPEFWFGLLSVASC